MNSALKNTLRIILFFSVGIIILYLVYHKQQQSYLEECISQGNPADQCSLLEKLYADFITAKVWPLITMILMFVLSAASRAVRWQMLLKPLQPDVRFINSFLAIILGYFANLGLPRLGEIVRAATMSRYEKITLDKVMGTVLLDRIIDVIIMFLITCLAFVFAFRELSDFLAENNNLSEKISSLLQNPYILIVLALILTSGLIMILTPQIRQSKYGLRLKYFIKGLIEGVKSIKSVQKPGWFIFHSLFIWVMFFMMVYVGFYVIKPTSGLGVDAALVIFTLGSFGFIIPSPGGMGTYHFLVTSGLLIYGVSGSDGFSYANITFFTVQIFGVVFLGIIASIILPFINKAPGKIVPKKTLRDDHSA